MATVSAAARAVESDRPPNVILLVADDLGWGDLGSYGAPVIRTPHLDRMAAEGLRFTSFYVASPVCSPSRAALLTGRLPVRTGLYGRRLGVLFPDDPGGMPAAEITLGEALADAGYDTGLIGKWHLGDRPDFLPTRHGFASWLGLPYSNDMRWEVGLSFPEVLAASVAGKTEELETDRQRKRRAYFEPRTEYWSVPLLRSRGRRGGFDDEVVEQPAEQSTLTRRYTEEAVAFLETHRREPFFLVLAYAMPHVPLFRSPPFAGRSGGGLYGDVVEEIDWSVGRILARLRELELAERTLVVFTSDNGPWLALDQHGGSAGPLRDGKGTTFEGGVRVPAIFWWPGTVAPGVTGELASTLDLLPTVLRLAGSELPADRELDGVDLGPLLLGTGSSPRRSLPYYRGGELYAFRRGAWKVHLVTEGAYGRPPERTEHDPAILYHLGEDPGERFDLAALHPEVVAELQAEARAHRDAIEPAPPLFDRRLRALAGTAPAP